VSAVARPFVVLGSTTLRAVESHAQAALGAWAQEWIAEGEPEVSAERVEAGTCAPASFLACSGPHGSIWIRHEPDNIPGLGQIVLGPDFMRDGQCPDTWSESAIRRARVSMNEAIAFAMTGSRGAQDEPRELLPLPAELHAPGSGAAELHCALLGLHVVIDAAANLRFAAVSARGELPPVSPLATALAAVKLNLSVPLGEVTLELGNLATLAAGDVLRLPKRLGEPIDVLCEGKPLARAALGESAGRKGIQILPADL
jgi:flagellar motor switch/type III secretory pathway protein FliN